MPELELDNLDKNLIDNLQSRFPLSAAPFEGLAVLMNTTEKDIIRRTARLKESGIIRQIGPVIDAARLGFKTALVAMKVAPYDIPEAARVLENHPGISHGYEREHEFNIWFTLAVPPETDFNAEVSIIAAASHAENSFALPAIKVFKLNAFFGMGDESPAAPVSCSPPPQSLPLVSVTEKKVLAVLQQDLPLLPSPFAPMADKLGLSLENFLAACSNLKETSVIRRYGAAVNHHRAGFTANGMTCWAVPASAVDKLGEKLAGLRQVSHCYERAVNPFWRYNIFAMIHARDRDECRNVAAAVAQETGFKDYSQLFSTRELKKMRVKYAA